MGVLIVVRRSRVVAPGRPLRLWRAWRAGLTPLLHGADHALKPSNRAKASDGAGDTHNDNKSNRGIHMSDLTSVKALVFDVFGTVVDWRNSLISDFLWWGKQRGITAD